MCICIYHIYIFHNSNGDWLVAKSCLTLMTPWTVPFQAPLFMGFPRRECWSGLPFPSSGNLPNPEIEPGSPALSPALQTESLLLNYQGRP